MARNVQKNVGNVGNDTILNKSIEQQFKRKQKMNLSNISKSTPIEPESTLMDGTHNVFVVGMK